MKYLNKMEFNVLYNTINLYIKLLKDYKKYSNNNENYLNKKIYKNYEIIKNPEREK